jgi:hypothetical protein
MKSSAAVLLFCFILSSAALAQLPEAPEPTQLELWMGHPGSRITTSEVVGKVESTDADAVITALVIDNPRSDPTQLRGIRIDLRNDSATDRIFVDESDLVYRKEEFDSMACSIPGVQDEAGAAIRVHGIARCRPSQTIPQAYCPGYYITRESVSFRLSTFSGHNFAFGTKAPSAMGDAIGRAMDEFGLDDEIPTPPPIALPADVVEQIVASAVDYFPELASSRGIKAAGYDNPEIMNRASVIFWPYLRVGDFAHSRTVYCNAIRSGDGGWICDRSEPRGYLTIADQDKEVVITGALDRDNAVAMIEFAKLKLKDEPNYSETDDGWFSQIHPLKRNGLAEYWVSWRGGKYIGIRLEVTDAQPGAEDPFVLTKISANDGGRCPY